MEEEHGVLINCSDEGKDRKRKIQSIPVFNWWSRKRNAMTGKKKITAVGNQTDEDDITVRQLFNKNFEDYCLSKEKLSSGKKKIHLETSKSWWDIWPIHHRAVEFSINMWVWRVSWQLADTQDSGWYQIREDYRHTRKSSQHMLY